MKKRLIHKKLTVQVKKVAHIFQKCIR